MSKAGHDVTIIDRSSQAFRRLSPHFHGTMIVGNGIDESVLRKAGIEKADAFVAVTNGDNTNIMSVQIAREKFSVLKVIARMYDPIRACSYRELGIDTICTTVVGARLIKDFLLGKEWGMASDYCSLSDIEDMI
jgi:trk system potassium uptake protein TrkA